MTLAAIAIATVAALVGLLELAWVLIRPRYRLPTPADEIRFAPTWDGWDLALYRYRPERPVERREPVVLCHGMLSNRFNVDLDEEVSLARYLRDRGFDAWVMELRGHGGSRRSGSRAGSNGRRGIQPFDWTIDHYVQIDLPAVLEHVRRASGSDRVHWFGHSMGGMLLYGHCAVRGSTRVIRSAVLSDAPASFATRKRRMRLCRAYGRVFASVPPALVLPFLGPAAWAIPGILGPRYGIGERGLVLSLLANAIIPWGSSLVLLHLCDILESGRFRSADGSIDYEKGVEGIDFPLMILSSARKLMGEPPVRYGFERSTVPEKRYVRLSRANGYSIDYTHSNLLVSKSSPSEVFPEIAGWFAAHSSA